MSFVHTDAGRVVLTETGQPVVEGGSRSETQIGPASEQARWAAAESEKQRLYIEARRRAALTQLAGGGELASMGLDETPQEEPPSYSPRDPANEQQQSSGSTSILVTSPSSHGAPVLQGQAYSTATPPSASAIAPSERQSVGLGIRNTPTTDDQAVGQTQNLSATSAEEKERMRLFFEQQDRGQNISSRPSASSLGHTSGNSSCIAAPPTTAHGTRSSEFFSAETEKDIMRRRYEAATRAVSGGHGDNSSRRSSFQNHSPMRSSISSSHDYSHSSHYAYQTAQQDQEQVQDRYEGVVNATSALRIEAEPPANTYYNAKEEKDIMRRRYEEAIAAAERQNSESSVNTIPGPSRLASQALPSATVMSHDGSRSLSSDASCQMETTYPSASEEKEWMRQRYEAAIRAQNSKEAKHADSDSGHFDPRQGRSRGSSVGGELTMSQPPPLPAKPPEIEQYKAILSSPTEEAVNPFMYMNSGMMPLFPMFPLAVPGIDYSQAANGYYYQPRGDQHQAP